ncbi:alpha amylase C-terminal domain-containing protein [Segetibacter koreensis]|uniref:alpha amylase C-terminal domain-containing protein n=1 Tax=Segetibacter koreensis TaxID=398037 RepID=UPI00037C9EA8|nr:alpha amylase C-terminal domain-containing protein [Segetibacter koreensis]
MNQIEKLAIIQEDSWLDPYMYDVHERFERYKRARKEIEDAEGSLLNFARGHYYYGINFDQNRNGWTYREWAPGAHGLCLIGDFNNWDRTSHKLERNDKGDWEIFLPYDKYRETFVHGSRVKVNVQAGNGSKDRIPAYMRKVIQDPETYDFAGQLWFPEKAFEWTDSNFDLAENFQQPIIYECHVGMAQEHERVGTYREFADEILPRIKEGGYNAIQLMAVMEHPYYGSFGYHVSNFFAPSSRFGTPEDLKYLVNKAHSLGITAIMDIVHSHAVKNLAEGLNEFDGTDHQYFHSGGRGYHEGWDSKLFDYGKWEVKKFLLSNVRYWLEEFHFDGYRFDGVTSMLYFHHGYTSFDHYDKYFKEGVDWDAVTYLQLANDVIHEFKKNALSIAEDVSGMPGLCRKPEEGGCGFDFRLGMGIPDYWIKILKHKTDEEWDIYEMWDVLSNRRYKEKTIAYAESHDQALVGDKSIAFWLMDKEMYFHMRLDDPNLIVDRGIALHKMLRLFTISLGGEGYLNFIGNEFGHPEWVDFPREGNNWSHHYARRQWSLVDNSELKYQYMANWDKAMIHIIKENQVLASQRARQIHLDGNNKVIVFERSNLIFIFNFSPANSIFGYKFWAPEKGTYQIVLNSDKKEFGGFERVDDSIDYPTDEHQNVSVYLTNRTALVMKKK